MVVNLSRSLFYSDVWLRLYFHEEKMKWLGIAITNTRILLDFNSYFIVRCSRPVTTGNSVANLKVNYWYELGELTNKLSFS